MTFTTICKDLKGSNNGNGNHLLTVVSLAVTWSYENGEHIPECWCWVVCFFPSTTHHFKIHPPCWTMNCYMIVYKRWSLSDIMMNTETAVNWHFHCVLITYGKVFDVVICTVTLSLEGACVTDLFTIWGSPFWRYISPHQSGHMVPE